MATERAASAGNSRRLSAISGCSNRACSVELLDESASASQSSRRSSQQQQPRIRVECCLQCTLNASPLMMARPSIISVSTVHLQHLEHFLSAAAASGDSSSLASHSSHGIPLEEYPRYANHNVRVLYKSISVLMVSISFEIHESLFQSKRQVWF